MMDLAAEIEATDPFILVRLHIRAAMDRKGLSNAALADAADVPDDFVSFFIAKRRCLRIPQDWPNFSKICAVLDEDPLVILKTTRML